MASMVVNFIGTSGVFSCAKRRSVCVRSLTTATKGLSNVSLSLKSRPLLSGMPSVAKAPGATTVPGAAAHRRRAGVVGALFLHRPPDSPPRSDAVAVAGGDREGEVALGKQPS